MLPRFSSRTSTVLLLAGAVFFVAAGMLMVFSPNLRLPVRDGSNTNQPSDTTTTARGAYEIAVKEATEWSASPKPVLIRSGVISQEEPGESSYHQLWFSSAEKRGVVYEIVVERGLVTTQREIPMYRNGGDLPANLLSEKEALEKFRQIPSFRDVPAQSLELIYEEGPQRWYWGVGTQSSGVITMPAEKN